MARPPKVKIVLGWVVFFMHLMPNALYHYGSPNRNGSNKVDMISSTNHVDIHGLVFGNKVDEANSISFLSWTPTLGLRFSNAITLIWWGINTRCVNCRLDDI